MAGLSDEEHRLHPPPADETNPNQRGRTSSAHSRVSGLASRHARTACMRCALHAEKRDVSSALIWLGGGTANAARLLSACMHARGGC
eukprot:358747-Chlamydomonas_euryale.AAC.2